MDKVSQFFSDWVNMLMGKSGSSLKTFYGVKSEDIKSADADNPINSDIKKVKEVLEKIISFVEEKIRHALLHVNKKNGFDFVQVVNQLFAKVENSFKLTLVKKILIGLLTLFVIIFTTGLILNLFLKSDVKQNVLTSLEKTPTSMQLEYRPIQNSIYADDKNILMLEEELSILVKQIDSTNIREKAFMPPDLDFSIDF
ncbi:MAG: hypothetical protein N2558_01510 [Patescibacteria group bacterium]|nr:hypothetical protein [Patescibacteria group bacterium]